MRRKREIKLSDVIHAILREDGLETPLNEYRAKEAWTEVMGTFIAKLTTNIEVRGGIMYIQVINASLKTELMMNRASIVARINQHVGAQVIQQIVVR